MIPSTLGTFSKELILKLSGLYDVREAESIVRILVGDLLDISFIQQKTEIHRLLSSEEMRTLTDALTRLLAGEPVQYVTGKAWFWEREFEVNPSVLIPRGETEELVKWVLDDLGETEIATRPSILDIGTGSGCIPITLDLELNQKAKISALDISAAALYTAQRNANKYNSNINFIYKNILNTDHSYFSNIDIILSNPPYVRDSEKNGMSEHVINHEPGLALFVPNYEALIFYKVIAYRAQYWLKAGGKLYFEINESFGEAMVQLMQDAGYRDIVLRQDLYGKDRFIFGLK